MNKIALWLLFTGHLLGDFYFQSSGMAKGKQESFRTLLLHGIVYFGAIFIVSIPMYGARVFVWALVIGFLHFMIDLVKLLSTRNKTRSAKREAWTYSIDQGMHALTIIAVVLFVPISSQSIDFGLFARFSEMELLPALSWILALLLITKPTSITIKKILSIFSPPDNEERDMPQGHPNTGAFIGIIERLIILLLISSGEYTSVGLVLTAKSIARYKKIIDDPIFSEYYLIGTLLSILFVIVTYVLILK